MYAVMASSCVQGSKRSSTGASVLRLPYILDGSDWNTGHHQSTDARRSGGCPRQRWHLRLLICQLSCHSGCTHACMMGVDVDIVTGSSKQQTAAGRPQTIPPDASGCRGTQTLYLQCGYPATSNLCCATRKKGKKQTYDIPPIGTAPNKAVRPHTHARRHTHIRPVSL